MPSDPSAPRERLVVVGSSSFLATEIIRAAQRDLDVAALRHDDDWASVLRHGDAVVCCALHPAYRTQTYDPDFDIERRVAEAAAAAGARTIMLSSRRVYPAEALWGATEVDPAVGDGPGYGRNKAETERRIQEISRGEACILRLGNIFGYEYGNAGRHLTFFARMLTTLKNENRIALDMSGDTRRDFLPVESVAGAVALCVRDKPSGVYNLGFGAATACRELAQAVIEGYGRGDLVEAGGVKDEFFLDMSKWKARFGALPVERDPRSAARDIGERLAECARS